MKVCWIKPFISRFRPNPIEYRAPTGQPHCLLRPYSCESVVYCSLLDWTLYSTVFYCSINLAGGGQYKAPEQLLPLLLAWEGQAHDNSKPTDAVVRPCRRVQQYDHLESSGSPRWPKGWRRRSWRTLSTWGRAPTPSPPGPSSILWTTDKIWNNSLGDRGREGVEELRRTATGGVSLPGWLTTADTPTNLSSLMTPVPTTSLSRWVPSGSPSKGRSTRLENGASEEEQEDESGERGVEGGVATPEQEGWVLRSLKHHLNLWKPQPPQGEVEELHPVVCEVYCLPHCTAETEFTRDYLISSLSSFWLCSLDLISCQLLLDKCGIHTKVLTVPVVLLLDYFLAYPSYTTTS